MIFLYFIEQKQDKRTFLSKKCRRDDFMMNKRFKSAVTVQIAKWYKFQGIKKNPEA